MSRYLVTGCSSRHANPEASKKDVSFSYLIAEALRQRGHEVEHRNPSLTEDVTSFDRVIVGIAPLHALGSNRAYGALSAIMRTWATGKLTLMIDDPDTGKIFSGIRTMVDSPDRLTKPFFAYKLEHDLASQEPWKSWLAEGVKLLRDSVWPTVLVPKHAWAGTPRLVGANPNQLPEIVGIDPTGAMEFEAFTELDRRNVWTVEAPAKQPWLDQVTPFLQRSVERHGNNALPRFTTDKERIQNYSEVRGVISPPVLGGDWWSSRLMLASACEALVLTDWQTVRPLGQSWTLTAEQADCLSDGDRYKITQEQHESLVAAIPNADQVGKEIENAV